MEYYRRIATPFSVIVLTMLGAVLSSRKTRGGSGFYLAFGLVSAALFVVMDRFSVVFSTKGGLNPLLAAWIPNIIFGLVTLRIYQHQQDPHWQCGNRVVIVSRCSISRPSFPELSATDQIDKKDILLAGRKKCWPNWN